MFGLSDFSGAPFSAYLQFSPSTSVSGLQANALLNSVSAGTFYGVILTGVSATAILNTGASGKTFPVSWTLIDTTQYPIS
jgi:hypothetical protein